MAVRMYLRKLEHGRPDNANPYKHFSTTLENVNKNCLALNGTLNNNFFPVLWHRKGFFRFFLKINF